MNSKNKIGTELKYLKLKPRTGPHRMTEQNKTRLDELKIYGGGREGSGKI